MRRAGHVSTAMLIAWVSALAASPAVAQPACEYDVECGPGMVCDEGTCEEAPTCSEGASCARLQLLLAAGYAQGFVVAGPAEGSHRFAGGAEVAASGTWISRVPLRGGWVHGPALELGLGVYGAHVHVPPGSAMVEQPDGRTIEFPRFEHDEAQLLLRPVLRLGWDVDHLAAPDADGERAGVGLRASYAAGFEHRVGELLGGTSFAHGPSLMISLPQVESDGGWIAPFIRVAMLHLPGSTPGERCTWIVGTVTCEENDQDLHAIDLALTGGVALP